VLDTCQYENIGMGLESKPTLKNWEDCDGVECTDCGTEHDL
jgi:hypothetical protein